MPTGHDWYNLAAVRGYPFDDAATLLSDQGDSIPEGLLVDARILIPKSIGRTVFVSGLTVTDRLVTILLSASTQFVRTPVDYTEPALVYTPLAAVNIVKSRWVPNRQEQLRPFVQGVAGWVVLGPGIEQLFSGRFSSHVQSALLLRCGRWYEDASIKSVSLLEPRFDELTQVANFQQLGDYVDAQPVLDQGIVRLRAEGDIEIAYEERELPTIAGLSAYERSDGDRPAYPVVVFRLKDRQDQNVLKLYAGQCAGRPDSDTCARTPMETFGGVTPDCDGNIELVFDGVEVVALGVAGRMGLRIDKTLDESCNKDSGLADSSGTLPDPPTDLCADQSSTGGGSEDVMLMMAGPTPASFMGIMTTALPFRVPADAADDPDYAIVEIIPDAALPYGTIYGPNGLPADWSQLAGRFGSAVSDCVADDSPTDQGFALMSEQGRLCLAVRDVDPDATWPDRFKITSVLRFLPSPRRNAGLALFVTPAGRSYRFLAVTVNKDTDSLEFRLYTGTRFLKPYMTAVPLGVVAGDWYELGVTVTMLAGSHCTMTATLKGLTDPGFPPATVYLPALPVDRWSTRHGVVADGSLAQFCSFDMEGRP